jgi:ATP-dependent Lhr-like helicase
MPLSTFHPAVARWFEARFPAPTAAQRAAWPAIAQGRDVLIAAPTGSGKTLAAFLAAIDRLVRAALEERLPDSTVVVYVSPLKALSNDIQRNLAQPLAEIGAMLEQLGYPAPAIRAQVRTGDTPAPQRRAMQRSPPHILVTTPESLYLLLTSESGRSMLTQTRSVIVDEIHALAGTKRGAHLALSLERLAALCGRRLQRIGLSATQKPMATVASFLVGPGALQDCEIVDAGHGRARDLELLLPDSPLEAVMSNEVWQNVYDRLAGLISQHRTTLVFANTRRMVERVTRALSERLGSAEVAAHHGSLSKEQRLDAEQRLRGGSLRALVATASLELGIDIGQVELVCQLGTPRSIGTFLQRVGRANHSVGGVPRGRLLPLSRDDLVECTALLGAVRAGELDALVVPPGPLDVLAQQLVAEVSARECGEDELYDLVRGAWPYRDLARDAFDELVRMLCEGFSTRRGRQSAYLHRDAVQRRLRPRRGARLTAITCGGAIPDNADYQVVLEPAGLFIGTLTEDFAIESAAGDIFQLGNCSYRILRVEAGRVRVEDARGQPPTVPFWIGEAPARSIELSAAVSRLRAEVDAALPTVDGPAIAACRAQLEVRHGLAPAAAQQLVDYLAAAKAMLGVLPTQQQLVLERFFDEAGDMQLVIHAPFGARINRAFGLLLRKRFCRAFNFELQAAATEDAVILSLGETHSFALGDVPRFLNSRSAEAVLVQAVLDAPLFATRWRWVATISLAVKRSRAGRKTPAPLQRMAAEDLISVVFPDQLACAENLNGEREIPAHPLVRQVLHDCLHEAMDIDGLVVVLEALENGSLAVIGRDLPQPSPLAQEILGARPYAFLDDAPLEERRTRAVAQRRWLDPETAAQFGQLDPAAIAAVRAEAWPSPANADELHDALMLLGAMSAAELARDGLEAELATLQQQRRASLWQLPDAGVAPTRFWVAAEQLPLAAAVYPGGAAQPPISVPAEYAQRRWEPEAGLREMLRGRLQATGPVTVAQLCVAMGLRRADVEAALLGLEAEGFVLRGNFSPGCSELEWCERRLLARIHRYTMRRLRSEIEPVPSADFMRFLLEWQGVSRNPRPDGPASLAAVLEQLEGFEVPAVAWETEVLPARLAQYEPAWLDSLCLSGRAFWARLGAPARLAAAPIRSTPIALLTRAHGAWWQQLCGDPDARPPHSANAAAVAEYLQQHGASFFDEIQHSTRLLPSQAEGALAELVAAGVVSADSYGGLRALLAPLERRRKRRERTGRTGFAGIAEAGRWSLIRRPAPGQGSPAQRSPGQGSPAPGAPAPGRLAPELIESLALVLLRRYGVVFRRLLAREAEWLPPWHLLLRALRRLEAQGQIRGGRFVAGVTGEQYALPEAVGALRATRRRGPEQQWISLSAADPLNLAGIVTPGARIPALAGNRLLLVDGVPAATLSAGTVQWLAEFAPAEQWRARDALLRTVRPAAQVLAV